MNPLALYLLALTRRHGWGLALDKHKAFLELTLCVEKLILMIPGLVQIKLQQGEEVAESVLLVQAPSRDASDSNLQMNHRNSSLSLWKQRRLSRASNGVSSAFSLFSVTSSHQEVLSLDDAMNMLPLPLFEIAVSLMQGWGVPKSIPAAMYFYKVAATLGDVDAMFDLGYLNLKLGNKMEAAVWLRDAVAGGRELTGETWIFKRKWGGDGR
ncbi:hypothetical protein BDR26DRAFT_854979 [Obelidium mucronatum]|nr:hypothetical protein BDR26DRAFT_854979 [Obelidium mucronatum]